MQSEMADRAARMQEMAEGVAQSAAQVGQLQAKMDRFSAESRHFPTGRAGGAGSLNSGTGGRPRASSPGGVCEANVSDLEDTGTPTNALGTGAQQAQGSLQCPVAPLPAAPARNQSAPPRSPAYYPSSRGGSGSGASLSFVPISSAGSWSAGRQGGAQAQHQQSGAADPLTRSLSSSKAAGSLHSLGPPVVGLAMNPEPPSRGSAPAAAREALFPSIARLRAPS